MALWTSRIKCHSPSYSYQYENKNIFIKWFTMYMDYVQGLSSTTWWFDRSVIIIV